MKEDALFLTPFIFVSLFLYLSLSSKLFLVDSGIELIEITFYNLLTAFIFVFFFLLISINLSKLIK